MLELFYTNNYLKKRFSKTKSMKIYNEIVNRCLASFRLFDNELIDMFDKKYLKLTILKIDDGLEQKSYAKCKFIKILNLQENIDISDIEFCIDNKINMKLLSHFSQIENYLNKFYSLMSDYNKSNYYSVVCEFMNTYKKYDFSEKTILDIFKRSLLLGDTKYSRFIYYTFKDKIKTDMMVHLLKRRIESEDRNNISLSCYINCCY